MTAGRGPLLVRYPCCVRLIFFGFFFFGWQPIPPNYSGRDGGWSVSFGGWRSRSFEARLDAGKPQISCAVLPTPFASFPTIHIALPRTRCFIHSTSFSVLAVVLSRVYGSACVLGWTLNCTAAAAGESRLPPEVAAVKRIDRTSSPVVTEIFKQEKSSYPRRWIQDSRRNTGATHFHETLPHLMVVLGFRHRRHHHSSISSTSNSTNNNIRNINSSINNKLTRHSTLIHLRHTLRQPVHNTPINDARPIRPTTPNHDHIRPSRPRITLRRILIRAIKALRRYPRVLQ